MHTEPTTLALPADLLAAIDKVILNGGAQSREELVENALRRQLADLRRAALDAEFLHMADDFEYQQDVNQLLCEFAHADGQTLDDSGPDTINRPR